METNKTRAAVAILVLVILGFAIFNFQAKITANAIKESELQKFQDSYGEILASSESCRCFEKEKFSCPKGFEIIDKMCRNETEKTFTNFLKTCSAYECFGSVVSWNGSEWSPKLNIGNEE